MFKLKISVSDITKNVIRWRDCKCTVFVKVVALDAYFFERKI